MKKDELNRMEKGRLHWLRHGERIARERGLLDQPWPFSDDDYWRFRRAVEASERDRDGGKALGYWLGIMFAGDLSHLDIFQRLGARIKAFDALKARNITQAMWARYQSERYPHQDQWSVIAIRGDLIAFIDAVPTRAEAERIRRKMARRHRFADLQFRIARGRVSGTIPWSLLREHPVKALDTDLDDTELVKEMFK